MSDMKATISQIRAIRELRTMSRASLDQVKVVLPPLPELYQTSSSEAKNETEMLVIECYEAARVEDHLLKRSVHTMFLERMLGDLESKFVTLDASRPWMIYWSTNALALMKALKPDVKDRIGSSIISIQSQNGGIPGGYQQAPHLATTYGGISALALAQDEDVWAQIDREGMYSFLMSMKQENGGFSMSAGAEVDLRAVYCALAVASLLNILTEELTQNVAEFIYSCQTFEGGFSATQGLEEAHGGYAFCGLAALCILGPPSTTVARSRFRLPQFIKWLSSRQAQPEKGFSGRTNKLVDGCYSHWVGGCWALLGAVTADSESLWDREGLQDYILVCCQCPTGGLRDKPDCSPDAYHSNYNLLGLSGAQNVYEYNAGNDDLLGDYAFRWKSRPFEMKIPQNSRVLPINPVHGLPEGDAERMHQYFKSKPLEFAEKSIS